MINESPIVTETRKVRCLISKKFGDDIERYLNYLMNQQVQPSEEKKYSVKDIRQKYPKAYSKWDKTEDKLLIDKFAEGKSLKELAMMFQRQPGAIRSRLKKLDIIHE